MNSFETLFKVLKSFKNNGKGLIHYFTVCSLLSRITRAREGKWGVISVASFEMEGRFWDMEEDPGILVL